MPLPQNRNVSPAPKKKPPWFLKFIATLRNLFVFCYSAPFICVLGVGYTYMEEAPVASLMDYLTEKEINLRKAAIFVNMQDFLSCYVEAAVSQMSDAFTGCFTMIIFCAAVSTTSLMLLWVSDISDLEFRMVYVAIFLLPLGRAGKALLKEFLEDRLVEKVRAEKEGKTEHGNTDNQKAQDHIDIINNIWWRPAVYAGNVLVVGVPYLVQSQSSNFKFAALLMGGTALLFYFGCAPYSRKSYENMPAESDLGKIRRICRVAVKKRKSRYPASPDSYYWKHHKPNHVYDHGQEVRLLPRVPRILGWLDKAAIVKEQSADSDPSPQRQEMKGDLCTVEEVSAVKSLVPLMCVSYTLFAYGTVVASANTFFVDQVSNLRPAIIKHGQYGGNDIPLLFVAKSIMRDISLFICWLISFAFEELRKSHVTRSKRIAATIIRIGIGMACALISCILAWRVEVRRLSLMGKENTDGNISMTTMALVPQFLVLGISMGLVEGGLTNLFLGLASKSMWTFENSFSQIVFGTGKLFTIPLFLIFSSWINETAESSRFNRYYLMLAVLNCVFLLALVYTSFYIRYAYMGEYPNDEETEMGQRSEHAHEEDTGNKCDVIKFGNSGRIISCHF